MSGATAVRPGSGATRIVGPAVVTLAVLCSSGAVALWGPARRLSDSPDVMSLPLVAALVVGAVAISALGALVVRQQPRNTIGWAFLVAGGGMGAVNLLDQYVYLSFAPGVGALPAATTALWIVTWMPIPLIWLPVFAVLLLFPHGQALSPRWAFVWWAAVGVILGQAALAMFTPGPMMAGSLPGAPDNPLGVGAIAPISSITGSVLWVSVSVCLAVGALSMVVRFRRSKGAERKQLKWLAFSALFVVSGVVLQMLRLASGLGHETFDVVVPALIVVGLASLPVSATIAILRYRLWEIDRLVSRTLAYAVVVAVLGLVYVGSVIGLQTVLPTGGSDLAVAASTLAVAAAFGPVRRRVQWGIDRRFNRSRYDAQRTVESFSQRLRDEVDLQLLAEDLRSVAGAAVRPRYVALWVRDTEPAP